MNKKRMRSIIICALVMALAIVTAISINIEPAKPKVNTKPILQTKEDTPETSSVEGKKENKNEEINNEETKETVPKEESVSEEEEVTTPEKHICTIEIRCDTVADTSKLENRAVIPYVPANGVILESCEVEFTPGESVFDILLRATRQRSIHMEYRSDGVYGGEYIEGIGYLYEMDAGSLSGWMYKVNGSFPNYGCSNFEVKDGDDIVWLYTCDLGVDVGDNSTW